MVIAPGSTDRRPTAFAVVLALLAVQFCFGSNYVVTKLVLTSFPPLVWAGTRIAFATVIMFVLCFFSGRPRPQLDRDFFLPLAGFALMGTILNQISFLMGLRLTTATNSSVLNTLIPIATLAIVTIRGQEAPTVRKGIGFLLALAGVLTIRKFEDVRFTDATFVGDLLTVFNCLLYACFLSFSKEFFVKHDSLWITAWLFLCGTIGINLIALPVWLTFTPPPMSGALWAACGYAIGVGTIAAYFLNFWALKYAKSSQVALFIYLQPIIASLIAYLAFGEVITFRTAFASFLIFCGMIVALSGSYGLSLGGKSK